jgi:hypothetical protein
MAVARRFTNQKEISALWPTKPSAPWSSDDTVLKVKAEQ